MKSVIQAIRDRRSQKTFTNRPVSDDEMRTLLEAAVLAPNHKMTQPWGFVVLGEQARKRYGEIKAQLRVSTELEPSVADEKRRKIEAEIAAVPGVLVVTQKLSDDPGRIQEDYAAVMMAIQNILLVATSLDLGSKVHTGDILNAAEMRDLVKATDDEQLVAIIHVGQPAEEMKPKQRVPAEDKTRWLP